MVNTCAFPMPKGQCRYLQGTNQIKNNEQMKIMTKTNKTIRPRSLANLSRLIFRDYYLFSIPNLLTKTN